MNKNGETIYGTRGNKIETQDWGVLTTKGKTWYAHIIKAPISKTTILLPNIKEKINQVQTK